METKVMIVTPEFAKTLLEKNTSNRPVKQSRVNAYASEIMTYKAFASHEKCKIVRPDVESTEKIKEFCKKITGEKQ